MHESGMVLGIDLGTTNYKAALYDAGGALLGLGSAAPVYNTDSTGRVELPVEQCVALVQRAIGEAADEAGRSLSDVKGLSYSSQANTFVLLDGDMHPLTPFVVWTDTRAKEFPDAYAALATTPRFLQTVGFSNIAPGMMAANIGWFQEHQPGVWAATRAIATLPDYLVYLLTGRLIGDSGSGALLGLWDLHEGRWWPEALDAANIPSRLLPELAYPGTVVGCTSAEGGALFGLPPDVRVVAGSLDHHVAAIGAGAGRLAPFSVSLGTVIAATCLDGEFAANPACCVGPGMQGIGWYRLGWHNHGTRTLNWYRQHFAPEDSIAELLDAAAKIPAGANLPDMELCPWEHDADKVFSDGHRLGDHGVYVAVILHSITNILAQMLANLQPDLVQKGIVVTGGGARSNAWMRNVARKINAPVLRSASEQARCLGAAVLASTGAGWYSSIEHAVEAMVSISETIQPE